MICWGWSSPENRRQADESRCLREGGRSDSASLIAINPTAEPTVRTSHLCERYDKEAKKAHRGVSRRSTLSELALALATLRMQRPSSRGDLDARLLTFLISSASNDAAAEPRPPRQRVITVTRRSSMRSTSVPSRIADPRKSMDQMALGFLVSVRRLLDSFESLGFDGAHLDSRRGLHCGRTRTGRSTTAIT
jgi:hypothetical protein